MGAADGRRRRGASRGITRKPGVSYPVLVPNVKGLEPALAAGAEEIAVFGAASESLHPAEHQLLDRREPRALPPVCRRRAIAQACSVRGYVSCVLGCPYQGEVAAEGGRARRRSAASRIGCYEVSLGDTIGVGTPAQGAAR